MKELSEVKLKAGEWYLVQSADWSPSGFTIACVDRDGGLICQASNMPITPGSIEGVLLLIDLLRSYHL